MTALLDVPQIRERVLRVSVEDYHRLGEGVQAELLRGIVIQKMPKSPLHRLLVRRLVAVLEKQIQPGFEVWKEDPLTFAESEPEPDVAVVRSSPDEYVSAHPHTAELVIEVAISSLEIDRVKAGIYAEAGVREYWIVCPAEKQVEVYREPSAAGYRVCVLIDGGTVLESGVWPGVQVNLGALFA